MLPADGWYRRLMQLNRLVLPAPLGPINPTIWPSRMSNETLSRAATPPKRRLTSRTDNKAASDIRSSSSLHGYRAHRLERRPREHPLPARRANHLWEFDLAAHV